MGIFSPDQSVQEFIDDIGAAAIAAMGIGIAGVADLRVPVHPEVALVLVGGLGTENRVRELAAAWTAKHGNSLLSYSQVKRIIADISMEDSATTRCWRMFATANTAAADLQWNVTADPYRWNIKSRIEKGLVDSDFAVPQSRILRLRGLLGPTVRADVATVMSCMGRPIQVAEIASILMLPPRQVRRTLDPMVATGWVVAVGGNRNVAYEASSLLRQALVGSSDWTGWYPWHSLLWLVALITRVNKMVAEPEALIVFWDSLVEHQMRLSHLGLELPARSIDQGASITASRDWVTDALRRVSSFLLM